MKNKLWNEKLWLRVLLVYGSNQHFVKPITLCQQHRREAVGDNGNGNEQNAKTNEPINLSRTFSNDNRSRSDKVLCLILISIKMPYLGY